MSEHTPGPWLPFIKNAVFAVMKGRKEVIKWTGFDGSDFPDDRIANVFLIAAAPDMLAALQRASVKLDAYVGVCKGDKELTGTIIPMVQAALAKATGVAP